MTKNEYLEKRIPHSSENQFSLRAASSGDHTIAYGEGDFFLIVLPGYEGEEPCHLMQALEPISVHRLNTIKLLFGRNPDLVTDYLISRRLAILIPTKVLTVD